MNLHKPAGKTSFVRNNMEFFLQSNSSFDIFNYKIELTKNKSTLTETGGEAACTGTLIHDDWVLTGLVINPISFF